LGFIPSVSGNGTFGTFMARLKEEVVALSDGTIGRFISGCYEPIEPFMSHFTPLRLMIHLSHL